MLTIHGSLENVEPGQGVQRVGIGRGDRVIVDCRVRAQAAEVAHRRLRARRLLDVGHHAARDLHRDQRIGIDVGVDRGFPRLELLGGVRDRLGLRLDLRLDLGGGLLDLRLFLLAAAGEGERARQRQRGEAATNRFHITFFSLGILSCNELPTSLSRGIQPCRGGRALQPSGGQRSLPPGSAAAAASGRPASAAGHVLARALQRLADHGEVADVVGQQQHEFSR